MSEFKPVARSSKKTKTSDSAQHSLSHENWHDGVLEQPSVEGMPHFPGFQVPSNNSKAMDTSVDLSSEKNLGTTDAPPQDRDESLLAKVNPGAVIEGAEKIVSLVEDNEASAGTSEPVHALPEDIDDFDIHGWEKSKAIYDIAIDRWFFDPRGDTFIQLQLRWLSHGEYQGGYYIKNAIASIEYNLARFGDNLDVTVTFGEPINDGHEDRVIAAIPIIFTVTLNGTQVNYEITITGRGFGFFSEI